MVNIRGQQVGEDTLVKAYEITLDGILEAYNYTTGTFKAGIMQGAANIPLSLMSLAHFADFLHGGAYKVPAYQLPYYRPGVQAQLKFNLNPITGIIEGLFGGPILVDIDAGWQLGPLGTIVPQFGPNDHWIALPPGAKPEQCEAIINSGIPHVLPKLLSDQDYYLSKEWSSLFFTSALITGTFNGIATGVRTLVQAGESLAKVPGSASLGPSAEQMTSLLSAFAKNQG